MLARGITETDVWTACDALLVAGARPTIERVRQHTGGGSPNTVSQFLDTWFKGLGARIMDPAAFSAPPDVPDPVRNVAKHLWEVALAETRHDFDQRLQDGLAAAVANVEAEKTKAELASAAAFEATAKATRLRNDLVEQRQLLDSVQRDFAAEKARGEEVRTALATTSDRLRHQEERSATELAAAVERADAADRRVALELERERTARAKAERQAESLQKSLDSLRDASATAVESAQLQMNAARDRELALKEHVGAATAELALERQRLLDLRAASEASAAEASAAKAQVARLQASIERLTSLIGVGSQRIGKPSHKRGSKAG